jgi:TonB-linked SusC/RagA family outer membrane protein
MQKIRELEFNAPQLKRIIKIMKFLAFFLATAICSVSASTYAQTHRLTIDKHDSNISEILKEIEQVSEFTFFLNDNIVDVTKPVSLHVKNASIEDVLAQLLKDTGYDYKVIDRQVLIKRMAKQDEQGLLSTQQDKKRITGKVIDVFGEPIAGVNIKVENLALGTITDIDGNFVIDVPNKNAVLRVSFIGYLEQRIAPGDRTELSITLIEDLQMLDEVVVVGYGTQRKVNLTGAVAQVDSKVFEARPVTSVSSALQGQLPGVFINPKTGNPNDNDNMTLNVRGTTSINGGDPLVLVDGIETSLKLVNPNDIESISVLKDAAASSIYGVRAAFGVILVTTKKGKAGDKATISYSGNFAWSKPTYMPEFTDNSYDHALFVNQSMINNNSAVLYSDKQMAGIKAYQENPTGKEYYIENGVYYPVGYRNWKDILIRNLSPKQTHNLSLSGGNGKTTFYASAAYLRQEGMLAINPDIYERMNARLNVENQTYDWMKIGLKMIYNTSKMDQPFNYKDDIWHALLFSSPLRGGQWQGDPEYPEFNSQIGNYFEDQNNEVLLKYGGRDVERNREIVISPNIALTPLKNWNIMVNFSYSKSFVDANKDKKRLDNLINNRIVSVPGVSVNDGLEVAKSNRNYYSFNAYTDYEFKLSDKHNFKVMAGFNQELTSYSKTTSIRRALLNPNLPSLSLGTGEQLVSDDGYEWALRGGFARLNYNYADRYLLEMNLRYDGTSRFPKDNRFVLLPSFSVGWRLSEESFMEFAKPLFNNIKLRASYGKLGNQLLTSTSWTGNTKYYPYIPFLSNTTSASDYYYLFNAAQDVIINPAGLIPSTLTWEKVSTFNAGVDLNLLDSRLDFSFDIFQRTTSDMLIRQEFPEVLGATAPVFNQGELRTRGWELSVGWRDRIGEVGYNIGVNLFDAQAEITRWTGIRDIVTENYEGKKIGEIWGYETEGFFIDEADIASHASQSSISNDWKAGDIKYKDRNNDGKINIGANTLDDPGDRKVIGNTTPRYNYGINADLDYRNFFFSFFIQGIGKRDFWPDQQDFWPLGTQYYNTQKNWITDSWTPENTNAYFPLTRPRSTQNQQRQTRYLQDASYMRLKNVTLGYNLPLPLINKVGLSKAQVYMSGENLFEISHIVGPFDPESAARNGRLDYPFQRVFSVGIDLTF